MIEQQRNKDSFNSLPENKIGHTIAITEKFNSYPERHPVLPGITWENLDKKNYKPPYYTSEIVLNRPIWADPENLDEIRRNIYKSYESILQVDGKDRPLNPKGPTGIAGRGILGAWGANFAADPIVTTIDKEGFLKLIVIKRKDSGQWALPGGMVDKGERRTSTVKRELGEETSTVLDFENATLVYQGYVDDPRNTDNAWMETDAYHLNITPKEFNFVNLKAGDDAQDSKWMICSKNKIEELYASHSDLVKKAISLFQKNNKLNVLDNGKVNH